MVTIYVAFWKAFLHIFYCFLVLCRLFFLSLFFRLQILQLSSIFLNGGLLLIIIEFMLKFLDLIIFHDYDLAIVTFQVLQNLVESEHSNQSVKVHYQDADLEIDRAE